MRTLPTPILNRDHEGTDRVRKSSLLGTVMFAILATLGITAQAQQYPNQQYPPQQYPSQQPQYPQGQYPQGPYPQAQGPQGFPSQAPQGPGQLNQAPQGQFNQGPDDPEADAPDRGVARISVMNGNVSIRRGDSGDLVAGALNVPVVATDRIETGEGGRAEVQFDWANMIRLAPATEVRFSELEYHKYQ